MPLSLCGFTVAPDIYDSLCFSHAFVNNTSCHNFTVMTDLEQTKTKARSPTQQGQTEVKPGLTHQSPQGLVLLLNRYPP